MSLIGRNQYCSFLSLFPIDFIVLAMNVGSSINATQVVQNMTSEKKQNDELQALSNMVEFSILLKCGRIQKLF